MQAKEKDFENTVYRAKNLSGFLHNSMQNGPNHLHLWCLYGTFLWRTYSVLTLVHHQTKRVTKTKNWLISKAESERILFTKALQQNCWSKIVILTINRFLVSVNSWLWSYSVNKYKSFRIQQWLNISVENYLRYSKNA